MVKKLLTLACLTLPLSLAAANEAVVAPESNIDWSTVGQGDRLPGGVIERMSLAAALKLAAEQYEKTHIAHPIIDKDNVIYPYGKERPVVVCSPLRICTIEFNSDELIRQLLIGDQVNWSMEAGLSGDPGSPSPMVFLKPTTVGLSTNLVVTTSRRTYQIYLESSDTRFTPKISFYYPDEMLRELHSQEQLLALQHAQRKTYEETSLFVGGRSSSEHGTTHPTDLNLDYEISAESGERGFFGGYKKTAMPVWAPSTVFDDGAQVFIRLPALRGREAPALVIRDHNGDNVIVNYRLHNGYYVVDRLFEEAILLTGVGKNQQRVVIRKISNKKPRREGFSEQY